MYMSYVYVGFVTFLALKKGKQSTLYVFTFTHTYISPLSPSSAVGSNGRPKKAAHRVKHVEGEEEDDMPATNLSKLVCLKSQDEKVREGVWLHLIFAHAGGFDD